MCYKDMCFCPFYKDCVEGDKCFRALTPAIEKRAYDWYHDKDGNTLISQYVDKPDCWEEK